MVFPILRGNPAEEYRNSSGRYILRHRFLAVSYEGPVQPWSAVGWFLFGIAIALARVDLPRLIYFS